MEQMLAELTPWVNQYGLIAIYIGMLFEGSTVILAAGVLCYLHMIPLGETIAVAAAGGITSDQMWYFAGRRYAHKLISRFDFLHRGIAAFQKKIAGKERWMSALAHFIYSGAVFIPLLLGMQHYHHGTFTRYSILGVSLWALLGVMAGYLLGSGIETVVGKIDHIGHLLLIFLGIGATVWLLGRYFRRLKY